MQLTVDGVGITASARIAKLSPTMVSRWRQLGADYANCFNDKKLNRFNIIELQADEIRTFVKSKKNVVWIFTMLEVWSRLWISFVVGRRSYRNVQSLIGNAIVRGRIDNTILFTTDGFEPYAWAVKSMLPYICIYAQVIKKRKKNRVTRITRDLKIGSRTQFEEALQDSEDSSTINTSFVERHNLTIRSNSSYLRRKTTCHARETELSEKDMALQKCYYNFMRPHMALRFGDKIKTPAMQAGITTKRLSFRDIFTSREAVFLLVIFLWALWLKNLRFQLKSVTVLPFTTGVKALAMSW